MSLPLVKSMRDKYFFDPADGCGFGCRRFHRLDGFGSSVREADVTRGEAKSQRGVESPEKGLPFASYSGIDPFLDILLRRDRHPRVGRFRSLCIPCLLAAASAGTSKISAVL